jgi:hypothetical protein
MSWAFQDGKAGLYPKSPGAAPDMRYCAWPSIAAILSTASNASIGPLSPPCVITTDASIDVALPNTLPIGAMSATGTTAISPSHAEGLVQIEQQHRAALVHDGATDLVGRIRQPHHGAKGNRLRDAGGRHTQQIVAPIEAGDVDGRPRRHRHRRR